jgi:hypothetical protein
MKRFNPFVTTTVAPISITTIAARGHERAPRQRAATKARRKSTHGSVRPSLTAAEALARAQGGLSLANYPAIIAGFTARGIPETEIQPRENVFTFAAWRAKGRTVKKGEHGIRIATAIPIPGKETTDPQTGETITGPGRSRPWTATVFHISQTEPITSERGVHAASPPPNTTAHSDSERSIPIQSPPIPEPIPIPIHKPEPPRKPSWLARFQPASA